MKHKFTVRISSDESDRRGVNLTGFDRLKDAVAAALAVASARGDGWRVSVWLDKRGPHNQSLLTVTRAKFQDTVAKLMADAETGLRAELEERAARDARIQYHRSMDARGIDLHGFLMRDDVARMAFFRNDFAAVDARLQQLSTSPVSPALDPGVCASSVEAGGVVLSESL
jgi:hypothetical protein